MRNQLKASVIDPVRLFNFEGKDIERGGWSIHYKVEDRDANGDFDDTKILIGIAYASNIESVILPYLRYFDYITSGGTPYVSFNALIADLGTLLDLGNVDTGGGGTSISVIDKAFADTGYVAGDGETVIVDATGGVTTIGLPAVADSENFQITVKKVDAVNNVIIDGNSSETIDGATTQTLLFQYDSLTFQCNGTVWWIV